MKAVLGRDDWSYITLYSKELHFDDEQPLDGLSPRNGGYLHCGTVAILLRFSYRLVDLLRVD